ncbi:MAG: FxsA family protein [Methylovirgula sp.]
MPFAATFLFGLGLWLFSEIFVFGLVSDAIGLGGAILATLLTSLLGALLLRRLGRAARQELKAVVKGGVVRFTPAALESGVLAALGGVLLILPGFLSDCVGLALLAPALRKPPPSPPEKPDVIDLSPQDWRRIDERDRN